MVAWPCPLSYPYPAWVATHHVPLRAGWPVAALALLAAVLLAYGCLKFYDKPVREWLRKRVLAGDTEAQPKKLVRFS